jgi:hypothetical protein
MDTHQIITDYADLLDALDMPGSRDIAEQASQIADQADELRAGLEDRQAATLLAEIAASSQSLASGSRDNLLGRHGLRIRMSELGFLGQ